MPAALKLLFRRTLTTSAMNPSPSSSSSSSPSSSLRYPHRIFLGVGRSRLAKGGSGCARLLKSVPGAHVNNNKKNILLHISNTNNILPNTTRKREQHPQQQQQLYFLSPPKSSSSRLSFSSSSSSSSSFSEEREKRVSPPHCLGGEEKEDMGVVVEDHKQNGVVSSRLQNGVVSDDKDHLPRQDECTKLLTLPTLLTLARVAAIPIFIATFYVNSWWGTAATTSIFVAAAITDWLDGYLARKMRQGTAFGAFLDPVADKLMVAATLVLLCSRPPETAIFGDIPWLFPVPAIAIIGREITMSAVREWAASQNTKILQAVAVNNLGKWKTATQMTALTILVATRDSSLGGSGTLVASGVALLYISAGLAVWSLVVYMKKISKVLLR